MPGVKNISSFALVCLLFIFSGAAGLILQLVWTRKIALMFGSTVQSASITAAAFMLGLGLGAYLASRLSGRASNLLRAFGILELGVAVSALVVTVSIPHVTSMALVLCASLEAPWALALVKFVTVFALLLVPCTGMGATLPILTQLFVARSPGEFGKILGTLYAVNTLGAAAGALAVDFVLVKSFGVWATALTAVAFDGCVGLGCVVLSYRLEEASVLTSARQGQAYPGLLRFLLFCSGFCGLALEIIWTRMLVFFSGTDVYAYALVLVWFLTGLVIGGAMATRFADSLQKPQLAIAGMFVLLGGSSLFSMLTAEWLRSFHLTYEWIPFELRRVVGDGCIILPSTIVLGMLFPLVSRLVYDRLGEASRSVGEAYIWNTCGSIAGSLGAGFLMIPYWGLQASLTATAVAAALAGVIALAACPSRNSAWGWGTAATAGALVVVSLSLSPERMVRALYGPRFPNIVAYGEDQYGSVALIREWEDFEATYCKNLYVDGFQMMANNLRSRRYASILAAVPVLLHDEPQDALVICLGLANTLRAVKTLGEETQVDCVELSPKVAETLRRHADAEDTLDSPRVSIIFQDGRNHLLTTSKRYDVIIAEPPPPRHARIVNLYSREYYENCRRALKKGGIVSHWLPLNHLTPFQARTILRAFQDVFPHTYLWQGADLHLCLVGSLEPIEIELEVLEGRVARHREFLNRFGLGSSELFLATFLRGPEAIRDYVADTPPLTDDMPYIEYPELGTILPGSEQVDHNFFQFDPSDSLPGLGTESWEELDRARRALKSLRLAHYGAWGDPVVDYLTQTYLARSSLSLFPDNIYFQTTTGSSQAQLEKAATQAEQKKSYEILLRLATARFVRGQDTASLAILTQLEKTGLPDSYLPMVLLLKAAVLEELHRPKESRNLLESLSERGDTSFARIARGALAAGSVKATLGSSW